MKSKLIMRLHKLYGMKRMAEEGARWLLWVVPNKQAIQLALILDEIEWLEELLREGGV